MENFVVSARKYRPITFESVVGQSHITTTLKNAIRTNHLAQAFLFCGPRGVGKTTCARILAKTINCQHLDDTAEPCGHCDSCEAFQHNASFNVHELDAASNNSVEDIRNLIDQVRYPPQAGSKKKVYIIDEVHMLSTSAFNAFLKTLEEPPPYAIFILATTEKHKILPTILSRCQIFDFNRIQNKDIADHLAHIAQQEGIGAEFEALELIAQKADGGLRDALSMFDLNVTFSKDNTLHYAEVLENLHILDYDYYFKMTDALTAGSIWQSYNLLDDILRKGFDGHQFLVGLLEHLRNLMVCKDPQTVRLLLVSERVQQQYVQQSQQVSLSFLLSALSVGSQCDITYKQAKNQRLHIEICLSKLAKITEVFNVASLPESNGGEKKNDKPVGSEERMVNGEERMVKSEGERVNGDERMVKGEGVAEKIGSKVEVAEVAKPTSKLRSTNNLVVAEAPKTMVAEPTETFKQQKPFSVQELKQAWRAFLVKRQDPSEQVILDRDYEVQDSLIHLKLDNVVQQDILRNFQPDLMQYLRQTLQNSTIQMRVEVSVQENTFRPYTQQEKFNYLAEKNPALIQLKQALALDLDY